MTTSCSCLACIEYYGRCSRDGLTREERRHGTRRNSSLNQIVDDIAKRGRHDIYVDDQYMGTVGDYDYANTEGAL